MTTNRDKTGSMGRVYRLTITREGPNLQTLPTLPELTTLDHNMGSSERTKGEHS